LSLPEEDYDRETNAILYMERARDIYRTQKNFQKDAALSEKMANLFGEESEKDNKLALYKEAFNAYRKAAAQKSRQQAEMSRKADEMLNKVGDLLYKPDNKQEVNAFFDEAIRGTGNDAVEKARILSLIGEFYKMKDVAEAIKYLGLKREMWQRAGKLFEEGNTLVEIGTIYKDTQNVAAATESYDAARAVYQRIDARAQDATGKLIRPQLTAYLMKLAAFYEEQDKQKAATVYEEALEAEMLAQTSYFLYSSISQILDNEGRLLLKMKTDEGQARAERLFQKVIEYYRKLKNADSEASALSAIGDLYKAAREKTDARAYYDRARAVYLANKKSDPMIDLLKKIGEIDIEATPGQSLLRYYLSAAESAGQAGDHVSQGVAFEAAGKFYRAEVGNKEKTIEYFEKARVAYQAAGMKMANIALLRAISYIYDEQGKKEKANELRKQADDLERTPN
jgi:tetratricopeptide (TPR) repeat protein